MDILIPGTPKPKPPSPPKSITKPFNDQPVKIGPIIDDVNHLKRIVMLYGKNVFKTKPVHDEILTFIIKNFVENTFLYNGRIIGSIEEDVIVNYDESDITAWHRQRQQLSEFWGLFIKHFSDPSIRDPTNRGETVVGEGTYGALLPHYDVSGSKDASRLIKYVTADKGVYHMRMDTHVETNYSWFVEFCSFVVVMAILIYIDCNLVIDASKQALCITKRYQNIFDVEHVDSARDVSDTAEYFLSYYSFMAKIDAPFINETTDTDEYVLGYIVEAYQSTISELYKSIGSNQQNFIDAFNLTYQIFEIMNKMNHLANLGIIISHRDISTKNIMYSQDPLKKNRFKIRLIDFGFMCSSISFKDGKSVVVGYHPFEMRDDLYLCNKRFLDIVLFIAWCLRYNYELFTSIRTYTGLKATTFFYNIITLNNRSVAEKFEEKSYSNDWVLSVWDYSAALDGLVEKLIANKKISLDDRLDAKRIEKIFTDVFVFMNEAKSLISKMPKNNSVTDIEKTDYGTVELYDITDTKNNGGLAKFYSMYEKNREAYLELSKLKLDDAEEL